MSTAGPAAVMIGLLIGLTAGLGGHTFLYAKGASYLTIDPDACRNCHIMQEQFDGWMNSSHRNVAVCNYCYAPRELVPKRTLRALLSG